MSYFLLTLSSQSPGLTVGDMVKLLCEAQRGSPPILCSFYLKGDLRELLSPPPPHDEAVSLLFPRISEQDAGNHTCEAESRVSMETSQPETFSLDGTCYPSPSSEPHAARIRPHYSMYLSPGGHNAEPIAGTA